MEEKLRRPSERYIFKELKDGKQKRRKLRKLANWFRRFNIQITVAPEREMRKIGLEMNIEIIQKNEFKIKGLVFPTESAPESPAQRRKIDSHEGSTL